MKLQEYKPLFKEEINVENIINDLINRGWSGSNESQLGAVEMLRGLATSNDPAANDFMKKLDDFMSSMK